jgi:hypothetical protein
MMRMGWSMNNAISLYKIADHYKNLYDQLYNFDTGEVNHEVEAQLDALLPNLENKCVAVAQWIKKLEAEQRELLHMKNEIKEREEAYNKQIASMQDYLKFNMEKNNINKITCPYFTLSIKKNPYSTEILDEFKIPAEYMQTKEVVRVEVKPDKTAIKEEVLKTGVQVPGAYVSQKTKLEICIDKI